MLLVVALLTSIYIIWNLMGKLETLEKHNLTLLENQEKLESDVLKHYQFLLGLFAKAQTDLVRVDKRGSYSSDDEVGFAFKVIKTSIDEVKAALDAIINLNQTNPPPE
jgi:hypothetical protein